VEHVDIVVTDDLCGHGGGHQGGVSGRRPEALLACTQQETPGPR
jgi:hypothetical protein